MKEEEPKFKNKNEKRRTDADRSASLQQLIIACTIWAVFPPYFKYNEHRILSTSSLFMWYNRKCTYFFLYQTGNGNYDHSIDNKKYLPFRLNPNELAKEIISLVKIAIECVIREYRYAECCSYAIHNLKHWEKSFYWWNCLNKCVKWIAMHTWSE